MKNKIILIATFFCIAFVSCKKALDTKPTDFLTPGEFYKTEPQLMSALAGVYDRLGDLRTYGQGLVSYMVFSDEFYIKGRSSGIYVNIVDPASLEIGRHWEALYAGIERANLLLDYMHNATGVSAEKLNDIKGQALFLRAYYYFLLVDQFGAVPLKLKSTKSPDEEPLPASSVEAIYNQIVKDMKSASGLVRPISEYTHNTQISKTAVQGILARVYLTMAGYPLNKPENYANAKLYADSVIKSNLHSLNPSYSEIFHNQVKDIYDTKECIWEVEFRGNNMGEIQEGGQIGITNGIYSPSTAGYLYPNTNSAVRTTEKLYNTYETGDIRRDINISPYDYTSTNTSKNFYTATQIYQRSCGKWPRELEKITPVSNTYNATNLALLRYADVLLMYAEADNNLVGNNGASTEATSCLNQVRRRAFNKPVNTPDLTVDIVDGLDQDIFQTALEKERFKEFAFEGLRKHDLLRWGIYVNTMRNMIPVYNASNLSATDKSNAVNQMSRVMDKSVLFPIPLSELGTNHKMKQNPGW